MKLAGPAMVTSPTGKGVIVMGREIWDKKMFELTDTMKWKTKKQTLKHNHFYPLAIPIPDELVYEKDISYKQKRRKLK